MVSRARDGAVRPSPQPGGRAPAPGDLALVQAFINSHYDLKLVHGADLFATPAALAEWLRRHDLPAGEPAPLTGADVRRAVAVREGLRTLAAVNGGGHGETAAEGARRALDAAAQGAAIEVRFGGRRPRFVAGPGTGLAPALGRVLAIAATAMIDGSWARLKVCPGEDCGWAFYDHSRNGSGRWCSMAVCGGRAKARAHYQRRHGSA
jgi:predicted RNA-binding Zn ribbon-like protein